MLPGDRCSQVPGTKNASPNTKETTYGTIVTYQCHEGYEFPDNTSKACIQCKDGIWNETFDGCTSKYITDDVFCNFLMHCTFTIYLCCSD